jgi:hypothetical protein
MSEMMKYQPQDYDGLVGLAKTVVRSSICAVKSPEDALMILLTGSELGLSAMQSLRGIHVVKGRPVLAADTMGAVVRKSGVCATLRIVESTDERCTYMTRRKDDEPEEVVMTWTMRGRQARPGLSGDNWKKYPQAMLKRALVSAPDRAAPLYPDVVAGLYDPDDAGAPARAGRGAARAGGRRHLPRRAGRGARAPRPAADRRVLTRGAAGRPARPDAQG